MKNCLLKIVAMFAICCGCSSFNNPFTGPPPAYKTSYGHTPQQKIQQLSQLALELPNRSLEEQKQLTQKLTAELASESDPILRRSLVRTIGKLTDGYSNPTLLAAANDADPLVRIAACESWGNRPSIQAVNALSKLLIEDNDEDVRLTAAKALGRVKTPEAIRLLGSALDDNNPAIQLAVMNSLRDVTGQELGQDVNTWYKYLASQTSSSMQPTAQPVVQATALSP